MPSVAAESRVKDEKLFLPTEAECRNECTVSSDMEMDSSEMEIEPNNNPPILGNKTTGLRTKNIPLGKAYWDYLQLPWSTRKVNQFSDHLCQTVAAYWPSDTTMHRRIHPTNPAQYHSMVHEPHCWRQNCILLSLFSKSNKGTGSANRTWVQLTNVHFYLRWSQPASLVANLCQSSPSIC